MWVGAWCSLMWLLWQLLAWSVAQESLKCPLHLLLSVGRKHPGVMEEEGPVCLRFLRDEKND